MSAKKYSFLPLFVFLIFIIGGCDELVSLTHETQSVDQASFISEDQRVKEAFLNEQFDVWVEVSGKVENLLSDDHTGSAHQRFIIRLANNHTILVSHNIDLAPRINDLARGDQIYLRGQYEYNEKGGVIHWTHHDPKRRHSGGWIEFQGKKYQ